MSYETHMTLGELSRATGIPPSTLKLWVSQGILKPARPGMGGAGDPHLFSEENAATALAIAEIRQALGDGSIARDAIAEIARQGLGGHRQITLSAAARCWSGELVLALP
jgi:hypothetical protein